MIDNTKPHQGRITDERLPGVTVLQFYVGTERPGLGMDAHARICAEPDFGRLVIEDARKPLDRLEAELDPPTIRPSDHKTIRP